MSRIKLDHNLIRVLKKRPKSLHAYYFGSTEDPWLQEMNVLGFKRTMTNSGLFILVDNVRNLIVKLGFFVNHGPRPLRRVPTLTLRKFDNSLHRAVLQPLVNTEKSSVWANEIRKLEAENLSLARKLYGMDAYARNIGKLNDQIVVFDW